MDTGAVKAHGVQVSLNDSAGLVTVAVAKCGGPCRVATASRARQGLSGGSGARLATADPSKGATYVEADFFSFGAGITYRRTANLGSAHMSGPFARHRGSINMSFHATKPATTVPVPKGCTGTPGKARRGVLKGMLRFNAGRVGRLTVRSFAATLEIPVNIVNCSYPAGHPSHFVAVSAENKSGHVVGVDAGRLRRGGGVFEDAAVEYNGGRGSTWDFLYLLSVGPLPNADYTYAPNLSTGTVTGGSPLHGTADYSGTPKTARNVSHGTLGGDLTAHFATLGTVNLFPHGAVKAAQVER